MRVRRAKRDRILADGGQAYPVQVPRTHSLAEVRRGWSHLDTGEETTDVVAVAGRVVFVRTTGKLAFATLQEGDGTRLQAMLSLAEVGEEALEAWKADVDLGDHVWVEGRVVSSRRGELSVMASRWGMASKALRPLPVLHKELSEESRVRQRYADLVVRQEARDMVRTKAATLRALRRVLEEQGFLEVETPVLQLVHGGAAARPFRTHMNAFDQDMVLRIALELPLKKAVVGGVDRVYEMGRIFRNEGVDATHSPEFTMLEAYQAWGDQHTVGALVRDLYLGVADALGARRVQTPAGVVDLDGEWRWLPVYDAVSETVGEPVTLETPKERLLELAARHGVEVDPTLEKDRVFLELLGELVEPGLVQPTFLCDYPAVAQPLARPHRSVPGLIEAWDLIIGGVERGTGFSELVDPVLQRQVLTDQSLRAAGGDPEAMELDEDFLRALEYGAPPMGGLGVGIDRLVMLFTGANIRETILFPHLKPEV
ncbi:lysine--tRNA ligase [Phycicoccus endophyticus]|uniref:Lysine--tRNA ligase n=1 Tax=Phycicoccus endophyticus TaxID=1690220 RepID=A0A7G9R663_9MICO|nr:lysine--tRNA ligase [Phycicoccus endophyticus]NHI19468.1 lysine--tRNA ligase [Phycicoccus endophyticus]QNN51088.1 lysine--tRNA ligase [Phycicoccus endophyticus]